MADKPPLTRFARGMTQHLGVHDIARHNAAHGHLNTPTAFPGCNSPGESDAGCGFWHLSAPR